MAKKVSKNAKVAQRAANAGSGKDHVRVIKSVKIQVDTLSKKPSYTKTK
jgi:hypothetical protein